MVAAAAAKVIIAAVTGIGSRGLGFLDRRGGHESLLATVAKAVAAAGDAAAAAAELLLATTMLVAAESEVSGSVDKALAVVDKIVVGAAAAELVAIVVAEATEDIDRPTKDVNKDIGCRCQSQTDDGSGQHCGSPSRNGSGRS